MSYEQVFILIQSVCIVFLLISREHMDNRIAKLERQAKEPSHEPSPDQRRSGQAQIQPLGR